MRHAIDDMHLSKKVFSAMSDEERLWWVGLTSCGLPVGNGMMVIGRKRWEEIQDYKKSMILKYDESELAPRIKIRLRDKEEKQGPWHDPIPQRHIQRAYRDDEDDQDLRLMLDSSGTFEPRPGMVAIFGGWTCMVAESPDKDEILIKTVNRDNPLPAPDNCRGRAIIFYI